VHKLDWDIARLGVVGLCGLAPLAFVGCESGLGVPLDATGRVARGRQPASGFAFFERERFNCLRT
jgi:hypothetical protein